MGEARFREKNSIRHVRKFTNSEELTPFPIASYYQPLETTRNDKGPKAAGFQGSQRRDMS